MVEKDYIMHFIQALFDALGKLKNSIDKGDINGAKQQLASAYGMFGKPDQYFITTPLKELITELKTKDGDYLKRLLVLSKLLFLQSQIENNTIAKKAILTKAQALMLHYQEHTTEFSFELLNDLAKVQSEIARLS